MSIDIEGIEIKRDPALQVDSTGELPQAQMNKSVPGSEIDGKAYPQLKANTQSCQEVRTRLIVRQLYSALSGSLPSSAIRSIALWRSQLFSQNTLVVCGSSGKKTAPKIAIGIPMTKSKMKSQRQLRIPSADFTETNSRSEATLAFHVCVPMAISFWTTWIVLTNPIASNQKTSSLDTTRA